MQVSVEAVNNIERRITVGIPAERVDSEVDKKLQEAAKSVRLDGFRPGKVPMKVVQQRFGKGIRQEVIDEVVRQSFFDAITQEDLKPAGMPKIEAVNAEQGKDLEYVAVIEVYPEVKIQGIEDIKVDKLIASVSDSDIDEMIETLRKQRMQMNEVKREAQNEDQVTIDFKGTLEGEAFDGGSAEDADLVLGSGRMIPGFEDGIVGMKASEEKTLSLTFPEDYHAEQLAGKMVEFAVKLNKVSEPVLPTLDDEFYKEFGVTDGGEESFRTEIRSNMERELENASKNKLKTQLFDALAGTQQVDVPAALVDQEISQLKQEMMQQYGGEMPQNFDLNTLPGEMFRGEATKRGSISLIVSQYVKDNKIELDEDKLKARIDALAGTYDDPEEVLTYLNSDEKHLTPFRTLTLEDQVVEHLLDTVQVSEVPSTYTEVVKPQPRSAVGESDEKLTDPEPADVTESAEEERDQAD